MVVLEKSVSPETKEHVRGIADHHYMLDTVTADEFSSGLPSEGVEVVEDLVSWVESEPEALEKRDKNREEVIQILNGESDKQLIIIGPCSLDVDTDYTELFDYIEGLQRGNPDAVIAWRGNGSKPRSGRGSTGPFNSVGEGSRKRQMEVYQEAFKRGIPIFTEITEKDQFSYLAPYLTGAWFGARDMGSTELRKVASATKLPFLVKNSVDGRLQTLWDAIKTLKSGTDENDGSGVNLGYMAATCRHEDGGPASFRVSNGGNPNVGIVARGYELEEEVIESLDDFGEDGKVPTVSPFAEDEKEEKSAEKAFEHLGRICMLGAKVNCIVILDGSHKVPNMLSHDKSDEHRFLKVLRRFRRAAKEGRIKHVERIRGFLGEVSVSYGYTDKNMLLTRQNKKEIAKEIVEFKQLDAVEAA